jgi:hypothetical protein
VKRALLALAFASAMGACGKSAPQPPPAAGPLIETITGFADRCDACKGDKECVRALRDEFDGTKTTLLANGARIAGDDKATWDRELLRLRACGDGAGLTFWTDQ